MARFLSKIKGKIRAKIARERTCFIRSCESWMSLRWMRSDEINARARTKMKTFVIDSENNITAFGAGQQVPKTESSETFKSSDELGKLAATWHVGRLAEVWNGLPGVTPVKKF